MYCRWVLQSFKKFTQHTVGELKSKVMNSINLLIQRASKLLPLLQGDFRQLSTPSCFAKIAVRPSTPNLKNPLQITSSRVKQLVQKLASTLANRYENWCVTNFAGTNTKKLDPLWLKLERYIQWFSFQNQQSCIYVVNSHFSRHSDRH